MNDDRTAVALERIADALEYFVQKDREAIADQIAKKLQSRDAIQQLGYNLNASYYQSNPGFVPPIPPQQEAAEKLVNENWMESFRRLMGGK